MSMVENPKSDYRNFSTGEFKPLPDLIPVIGLFTFLRRKISESGLPEPTAKSILSVGTESWPKPTDLGASLRMHLYAARNGAWAGYQAGVTVLATRVILANLFGT